MDKLMEPGELLETGAVSLRVVPAAGHSLGQIALFERSRVLIAGDAILAADVPCINPFLDGAEALETAIATVERIGLLDARLALAGPGDVIEDVGSCVKRSLERLQLWRHDPAKMAFHASRRILGFALVIHGGFTRLVPYLLARRWVNAFAPLASLPPTSLRSGLSRTELVQALPSGGSTAWFRPSPTTGLPASAVELCAAGRRRLAGSFKTAAGEPP